LGLVCIPHSVWQPRRDWYISATFQSAQNEIISHLLATLIPLNACTRSELQATYTSDRSQPDGRYTILSEAHIHTDRGYRSSYIAPLVMASYPTAKARTSALATGICLCCLLHPGSKRRSLLACTRSRATILISAVLYCRSIFSVRLLSTTFFKKNSAGGSPRIPPLKRLRFTASFIETPFS
jgi:hypothetical protein